MAHRMHRVGTYDYSIDAGLGEPGRLRLWAPDGHRLAQLGFVSDDAAVPTPRIAPDLSSAAAFIKYGTLAVLIDMLRHEQPVYVTFDDRAPGFVLVHTRKTRKRADQQRPQAGQTCTSNEARKAHRPSSAAHRTTIDHPGERK